MRFILIIFISLSFFIHSTSYAQTNIENKNPIFPIFNLTDLLPFTPGRTLDKIPKELGEGTDLTIEKALKVKRYLLTHQTYKFPVWVQYNNNTILDSYIRLPSYFLHDSFFQSLINRYGQHSKYIQKDSAAVYIWTKTSIKRVYSGTCTITCFPIYFSMISQVRNGFPSTYIPLLELFEMQLL